MEALNGVSLISILIGLGIIYTIIRILRYIDHNLILEKQRTSEIFAIIKLLNDIKDNTQKLERPTSTVRISSKQQAG